MRHHHGFLQSTTKTALKYEYIAPATSREASVFPVYGHIAISNKLSQRQTERERTITRKQSHGTS